MTVRKHKIAVLFPIFLGGGAEAVCAWILEALKRSFDVTLITFSEIDFESLNRLFGVSLTKDEIRVASPYANTAIARSASRRNFGFSLRLHLLMRYFKTIRSQFDVAISAYNEMDLGEPGIQYIHFPVVGHGHERIKPLVGFTESRWSKPYRWICELLSGYSDETMRQNLTLTNSEWTASLLKEIYGLDSQVIYPPVKLSVPEVPWDQREEGFVCVGRLTPEKRVERAIAILSAVRQRGHEIHLHLISSGGDAAYEAQIRELAQQNPSWIFWERGVIRDELGLLLAQHKYGIHMTENEQFGIAVAEMVKAGCIPFVPANGGQVEIVGKDNGLTFHDRQQAVENIVTVISNQDKQSELLHLLQGRRQSFDTKIFQDRVAEVVVNFLMTKYDQRASRK